MLEEVRKKAKPLFEKFKKEMLAKGYPEGLVNKAIERAEEYVQGVTKFLDGRHPELVKRAQEEMIDDALEHSRKWIEELYKVFTGRKPEEKLKEAVKV